MTNSSDFIKGFLGKPIWGARKGHGSFLIFNLGEPRIDFEEPKIQKAFSDSEIRFPKDTYKSRLVTIKGDYFIWIYCCDWTFSIEEKIVAHNESNDKEILNAIEFINGQIISSIYIDSEKFEVKFNFDLAGSLTLRKNEYYESEAELLIMENNGKWLSINDQKELKVEDSHRNIINKEVIETEQIDIKN